MKKGKKIAVIIIIILSSIVLLFFSHAYINAYFIEPLIVQKPVILNKYPIPAVLYKTGPLKDPPNEIQNLFKKIKQQNPDYKIKYYNDTQCRNFIEKNFDKKVVNAYDKLIPGSFKADLFRYCILYQNGGIYGDLSQTYLVPLNELVDRNHDVLVLVRDNLISSFPQITKHAIQISFMAAQPKLSIFRKAIEQIVENVKNNYYGSNPLAVTGPLLLRKILDTEDIPYRLELELRQGSIKNINTGKSVIQIKLKNHNKFIKKNFKNAYYTKWYTRNIYKN